MIMKSLKSYLYYFSWNYMIFRYSYWSRILVLFLCIVWRAFTRRAYIYHAITCHLPDITLLSCYHLTSGMTYLTPIIIMIARIMTSHLVYILIYSSINCTPDTPVLLINLTCSCSFPKSDNYLINYKKGWLTSGRENLEISIYVRFYSAIRYVVQLNLLVRPEGLQVTEGSAISLLLSTILKMASYKTLLYSSR